MADEEETRHKQAIESEQGSDDEARNQGDVEATEVTADATSEFAESADAPNGDEAENVEADAGTCGAAASTADGDAMENAEASADVSEPAEAGAAAQAEDAEHDESDASEQAGDADHGENDPGVPTLIDRARAYAQAGGEQVAGGVAAVRELAEARRAHQAARFELEALERQAGELTQELGHRREVEANFDAILALQQRELAEAAKQIEQAEARCHDLEAKRSAKEDELAALRKRNEKALEPYKKLADDSRTSLSRAQASAAEARRALKVAQAQANEAQASRDSKLQAAQRAAVSAQNKLAKLQDQLAEARRNPSAGARGVTSKSGEVAAALAALERARGEVTRTDQETQQALQIAQTHLYTQRKSLEEAEADLEAAGSIDQARRDEHERLSKRASDEEDEVSEAILALNGELEEANVELEDASGRSQAAASALEEAREIHAHPELTEQLAERESDARARLDEQRALTERLATEEDAVRERTQHTRMVVYALAGAAVVIVLLVVLFAVAG